ncbi:MAG TPA: ABC transporter ATP-binding protein [Metalysinibacillus jejuensis]|uniref:ABC transporter ATP-binding protein n=1 Tax=Metalysinibacillus jejuensis TaxID=914327 RepID=A0A921NAA9_9BACL|nr:ABC transporter ATP-binding protein [Metalysinibacillus jejuensis]HJH10456.1 ABC transporter ATP-binding protein [Metalysinibacillus jejuensis]
MKLTNITKVYGSGELRVPVLHGIDLTITDGEFVAIMGPSGSGKSTLMNIIGFLDKQTEGTYFLHGNDVGSAKEKDLAKLRNEHIGFVFQQFFLLPRLNAQKNVETPLIYAGVSKKERAERAKELLDKVGLAERMGHLPSELSGGQKQRVAIARALVNNPSIILADEPTGALDSKTGVQIMELLTALNQEGKTVIIVTHEEEIAAYTDRIIVLRDGLIVEDKKVMK